MIARAGAVELKRLAGRGGGDRRQCDVRRGGIDDGGAADAGGEGERADGDARAATEDIRAADDIHLQRRRAGADGEGAERVVDAHAASFHVRGKRPRRAAAGVEGVGVIPAVGGEVQHGVAGAAHRDEAGAQRVRMRHVERAAVDGGAAGVAVARGERPRAGTGFGNSADVSGLVSVGDFTRTRSLQLNAADAHIAEEGTGQVELATVGFERDAAAGCSGDVGARVGVRAGNAPDHGPAYITAVAADVVGEGDIVRQFNGLGRGVLAIHLDGHASQCIAVRHANRAAIAGAGAGVEQEAGEIVTCGQDYRARVVCFLKQDGTAAVADWAADDDGAGSGEDVGDVAGLRGADRAREGQARRGAVVGDDKNLGSRCRA